MFPHDPAWKDNPLYTRLARGYLAFCDSVDKVVEDNPDWKKRERAKFLTGILTSAMSPTNTLLGNPAALKKAYETGGMSLVRGTRNMVGDMVARKGLPSQVKASDFKLGENLAATPGAVVFRNEMLEVIQYTPVTAKVHEIPTIIMVPPIGKYYFMDLAPGRSFVQHSVSRGIQTFITSWRQPQKENADWGLDEYVQSLLDTVGAACEVTGSKKVNVLGLCALLRDPCLLTELHGGTGDTASTSAAFG
jgi:polyhydroxyalkanoate synthase